MKNARPTLRVSRRVAAFDKSCSLMTLSWRWGRSPLRGVKGLTGHNIWQSFDDVEPSFRQQLAMMPTFRWWSTQPFYNKKHLKKCWAHSPLRAAVTSPFTRCRYCRMPAIAIAQAAYDVHDNNDDDDNNNDNAWQRGPLWPHRMGPKYFGLVQWKRRWAHQRSNSTGSSNKKHALKNYVFQ